MVKKTHPSHQPAGAQQKESLSSAFKRQFFKLSPKSPLNGRRLCFTNDVGVQYDCRSSDEDEPPSRSPSLTRRAQSLLQRLIASPKNRRKAREKAENSRITSQKKNQDEEETSNPTDATDNTDSPCTRSDTNETITGTGAGTEGFADSNSNITLIMNEDQGKKPGMYQQSLPYCIISPA